MPPFVGMLFTFSSVFVSMTSTAPGADTIPTYTRAPSLLIEMLFGRPVSGIFLVVCSVLPSTTCRVCSASLLKKKRLPSGNAAAPWLIGMPLISPTIAFVAGSMRWMLSPAGIRLDDAHLGVARSGAISQDNNDGPEHSTNENGSNHDASLGREGG